jgi:hypothetical protein
MGRSYDFLRRARPGNVVLITMASFIHDLVCSGQAPVTSDGQPSRWGHAFFIGRPREDGQIRIYESDISLSRGGLKNGAQENTLTRYGHDRKNRRICILDFHLDDAEVDAVIAEAQRQIALGVQYPVLELVGTLWAYLTRKFRRPNPLDLERASYCSAFVNDCFAVVERIVPGDVAHPTNVSPEHLYRSDVRDPERLELEL